MIDAAHHNTASHEEARSVIPPVGCVTFQHPVHGQIAMYEVQGLSVQSLDIAGSPASVVVSLYQPSEDGGVGTGSFNQMSAEAARKVAASLIRMADRLEQGDLPG